jgi:ABC-type nitrate/sulfonate/bicarbonate transport system substrate-binding protein
MGRPRMGWRTVPVVLLGVVLLGLATPAYAQQVLVAKSTPHLFSYIPYDVAVQRGYFAREGLAPQLLVFNGAAKLQAAVIAGEVDISLGSPADLAAIAKGLPETAVAQSTGAPVELAIIVPADSKVQDIGELKGARIGIATIGSITEWAALQMARKEGWNSDDLHMISIGASPSTDVAALKEHVVDAVVGDLSEALQLEQHGAGRLLAPASSFAGPFIMHMIYASNSIIRSKPEVVRKFLIAWFAAVDDMRRDKANAVAVAAKVTGFDPVVLGRAYDLDMPAISTDGRFDRAGLSVMGDSFQELGILKTRVDVSQFVTERFLPPSP